ncbi:class I SAM-dependent methyltransferase [Flavobacterium sp.]|jgi:2-polyprenyl-3-methyl-5-hydroxy-6-metoxy-1,4-benzoquinol methylase|uniref:class I SAM-dependent methyltransferase n=1 Tax=Flavobacterium sp. TaxID=239 RepID=UPI0037BF76A3
MKETKIKFKNAISEILKKQGTDEVLSEAALPAYAHKNPIIDYIFWKRLSVAKRFIIEQVMPDSKILDFGCGTGIFSYDLAKNGFNLTSLDLDLSPLKLLKTQIQYPESINFIQDDFLTMNFETQKFDVIVALDVLEHISLDVLPIYLEKFDLILKPNGYFIVSGPTENKLYKLGRKIAGNDFTGHYHETNISEIKAVFKNTFQVNTICKLIWPFFLFEIFYAKKI